MFGKLSPNHSFSPTTVPFYDTHLETRSAFFRSERGRNCKILERSSGGSFELIFPTSGFPFSAIPSLVLLFLSLGF